MVFDDDFSEHTKSELEFSDISETEGFQLFTGTDQRNLYVIDGINFPQHFLNKNNKGHIEFIEAFLNNPKLYSNKLNREKPDFEIKHFEDPLDAQQVEEPAQGGFTPEWKVTQTELLEHVIDLHLKPRVALWYGAPQYDLEVCEFRGFDVAPLVEFAYDHFYQLLDPSEVWGKIDTKNIRPTIVGSHKFQRDVLEDTTTPAGLRESVALTRTYQAVLGQTLFLIEHMGLGEVDWSRINETDSSKFAYDPTQNRVSRFYGSQAHERAVLRLAYKRMGDRYLKQ